MGFTFQCQATERSLHIFIIGPGGHIVKQQPICLRYKVPVTAEELIEGKIGAYVEY